MLRYSVVITKKTTIWYKRFFLIALRLSMGKGLNTELRTAAAKRRQSAVVVVSLSRILILPPTAFNTKKRSMRTKAVFRTPVKGLKGWKKRKTHKNRLISPELPAKLFILSNSRTKASLFPCSQLSEGP